MSSLWDYMWSTESKDVKDTKEIKKPTQTTFKVNGTNALVETINDSCHIKGLHSNSIKYNDVIFSLVVVPEVWLDWCSIDDTKCYLFTDKDEKKRLKVPLIKEPVYLE